MNSYNSEPEIREDIPLRTDKKSKFFIFHENYLGGSKYIIFSFASLSAIITVALIVQIHYGDYQTIPHGSVATDSLECSNAGTYILKQGGKALDAAIASTICLVVATPHVTSLEAEGIILIYNHRHRFKPLVIDFSTIEDYGNIPRMIIGLFYAHEQYGVLPWKILLRPAIDLARQGSLVSKQLVQALAGTSAENIFGKLEPGQLLIHESLVQKLTQFSNLKKKDINHGKMPITTGVEKFKFSKYNIFFPNYPFITLILYRILHSIREQNLDKNDSLHISRLVDVIKKTYNEQNISTTYHEGTFSNVAVMDTDDNYVSVVTGLHNFFDSGKIISDKSYSRFPIIIADSNKICGRRFVLGANNAVVASQIIMNLLIKEENSLTSVESPRFYILKNGSIAIEDSHLPAFEYDVLTDLETSTMSKLIRVLEPYQSINIVEKLKDNLKSHSDSRGGGIASRY